MKFSDLIILEMDLNMQFNSKSSWLYHFTEEGSYSLIMNLAWTIGLILNIISLATYRLGVAENTEDQVSRKLTRES